MLVNCIAYQDGRKQAEIKIADIRNYVSRPDCFVWVALKDGTPEELAEMQQQFDLHPLAVEDSQHGHQRPKIEEYGDTVFVVVQMIEVIEGELNIGEVDIFAGRNFILSVRNRSKQNFMGVRDRCEREPHLLKYGSGFVLYALIDAVVDRYFPVVEEIEDELEMIEEQIFARTLAPRAVIEKLYALKRKALVVKHAVAPLAEAISRLYGGRVPAMCADTQEYFRDINDHLGRLNTNVDALRDVITAAMQVNLSLATIEDTEVTKKLAAWAGVFATATAFVGIWGMNFKNMPELEWVYGYPAALGVIFVVCAVLYRHFRKSGWL
ncbi:MAG: magnesium/cobalt transporter CorA [Rhodobacteraceae bacterium]|nr:magnesium/cobalt transporter CorA [Paracoccaceae bacterium]